MHIQSYFKKGGERMKWKIIALLLVAALISGCGFHQENKVNQRNENYYKLNTDTTISNYEKLSDDGIDYIYPNFLSRKWSSSKQLERESSMKVNKSNDAEFYVIRKNYLNFLNKVDKSLDGQELKSCMQEEIKKYLGSLTPEDSKMNYVNINLIRLSFENIVLHTAAVWIGIMTQSFVGIMFRKELSKASVAVSR